MTDSSTTSMVLVTVPEWGHLSPFLHLATSIQRNWDISKGTLRLAIASMEQVRCRVEARGIDFLSIGTWEGDEEAEYARGTKAAFDADVPFLEKMRHGSTTIMRMLGTKMGQALFDHLQAAKVAGTLPDVIVTDGLTSAGFDAAEKFQLPLAVIWPFPLSMCLMLAGYPNYNFPTNVPLEVLEFTTHEEANPLVRNLLNPFTKRFFATVINKTFGTGRHQVRKALGLRPLSNPDLRKEDGTVSGVLNKWGHQLVVQPCVPRTVYLAGVTWEMNAMRDLPPCWHMVGPLVIDRHSADFPPKFGPEDAAVEAFLQEAADAGDSVIFTAAGSMTHLSQQQVNVLVDTFTTLTAVSSSSSSSSSGTNGSSGGRVRVLWALRSDVQHLLPEHLRSSSNAAESASGASPDAAAPADTALNSSSSKGRIMVASWVKQTAVLAHPATKVFVTHGGLGSVHECLALGQAVPLVVPFSNGADHVTIGQQLVNRGLGVMLKPAELLQKGQLLSAVQGLLRDQQYKQRVADVAHKWDKAGYGPKMAAEMLIDFAVKCHE